MTASLRKTGIKPFAFARKLIHPKPLQVNGKIIFLLSARHCHHQLHRVPYYFASDVEDYYMNKRIEFDESDIVHKVIVQVIVTGDFVQLAQCILIN